MVGGDRIPYDGGEDVGRQGLSLGGGGSGERAVVGLFRGCGRQPVFLDLLLDHRQALEDDLRPGASTAANASTSSASAENRCTPLGLQSDISNTLTGREPD
ncbi:hypothetical protein ACH40F_57005 [Streptomyces sp. NPDC020794]|uniref:hypothetical protein n=1 Tax=unclassified Streptomyces TaxID=2593676 RepID=UPI0036EBB3DE